MDVRMQIHQIFEENSDFLIQFPVLFLHFQWFKQLSNAARIDRNVDFVKNSEKVMFSWT